MEKTRVVFVLTILLAFAAVGRCASLGDILGAVGDWVDDVREEADGDPTFGDWFDAAKDQIGDWKDTIVENADDWFDQAKDILVVLGQKAKEIAIDVKNIILEKLGENVDVEELMRTAEEWKIRAEEELDQYKDAAGDQIGEWKDHAESLVNTWNKDIEPQLKDWKEKLTDFGEDAGEAVVQVKELIQTAIDNWDEIKKELGFNECERKTYNHNLQICCQGNLYLKYGLTSIKVNGCCGNQAYDVLDEQCCYGNVIPEDAVCSGPEVYDGGPEVSSDDRITDSPAHFVNP